MNEFEEVRKIYSYFRCNVLQSLLNSIQYIGEVIFKLKMQENNITSLLGEKHFLFLCIHFLLSQKHHKITFVNFIVHCVFNKGYQIL